MTAVVHWDVSMTALSSISHGGQTRGTTTLLRREIIPGPSGPEPVPVISGNAFRGRLRRIAEGLFTAALAPDGPLSLPAAHALRNGGALAKTGRDPLNGAQRSVLRALVPPLGVFGAAAGASIIDGCLQVGKVVPIVRETAAITGIASDLSAFDLPQLEEYSHLDDVEHDAAGQMRFVVETFPAGSRFATWARIEQGTDLQISFFTDVLAAFTSWGQLGGRLAIGHGRVAVTAAPTLVAGTHTEVDWRAHVTSRREEILEALGRLG